MTSIQLLYHDNINVSFNAQNFRSYKNFQEWEKVKEHIYHSQVIMYC